MPHSFSLFKSNNWQKRHSTEPNTEWVSVGALNLFHFSFKAKTEKQRHRHFTFSLFPVFFPRFSQPPNSTTENEIQINYLELPSQHCQENRNSVAERQRAFIHGDLLWTQGSGRVEKKKIGKIIFFIISHTKSKKERKREREREVWCFFLRNFTFIIYIIYFLFFYLVRFSCFPWKRCPSSKATSIFNPLLEREWEKY